jgi:hypothetical protein
MHRSIIRWVVVAGLFISSTSWADSVSVTITGTGGTIQNNVYVAPYYLNVSGGGDPAQGIQSGTLTVICDDYTHDVTLGEGWIAQINDFTTSGLTQMRFDSLPNAERLYEEAGWLAMQTGLWGGTQQSASMIGEYNWAIWSLFDPSLAIDSTAQGLVAQAQKYAPNDLSYYSNVRILTPVAHTNGTPWTDSTSPQEYITIVSAPEPSSLALLGSGLAAFIFRTKKKRANP